MRVYPLLVIINKDVIETIKKSDTEQSYSVPFKVELNSPFEIEPILPGCDCQPSKVVAQLVDGVYTATFWVAPRVLGRLDGSKIQISQNNKELANIPLKIVVSKRGWAIFTAILAFGMPGFSAALKHFGVVAYQCVDDSRTNSSIVQG